jgi:RHS repeat-associated protein
MPVDLASGAVFTASNDFQIPGSKPILWRRYYSTDSKVVGSLGHHWTVPYLMQFRQEADGYSLTNETGAIVIFALKGGQLRQGISLFNFGARMELTHAGGHYVVTHWHDGGNPVERYGFNATSMYLDWIETVEGHRLQLYYDLRDRSCRIEQVLEQRVVEITYGENGLIESVWQVSAHGRRELLSQYRYDARNNLTQQLDALGFAKEYEYDDSHRVTAERNLLGATFSFDYDSRGRCIHCTGNGHYVERTIKYREVPRITTVTNSTGDTRQYLFNHAGQLLQETSPTGAVETYSYDGEGRLVTITHADGSMRQYQFDAEGNRVSIIDERGAEIKVGFNRAHLPTSLTDSKGAIYSYDYDSRGALTAYTNPLGSKWTYTRDSRSLLVETRYPGGRIVRQRHDPRLRWVEAEDDISLLQRIEYGEAGEVQSVTVAGGVRRSYVCDRLNRPILMRHEDGTERVFQWNAAGELLSRRGPADEGEDSTYDHFGNLVAHRNSTGDVMRLEYDTEGRLTGIVNRSGERMDRSFGPSGKISQETFFDGRTVRYKYNLRNCRTELIKSEAQSIVYAYDPCGNLLERTANSLREQFVYDENSEIIAARNNNSELLLERDALRRITAEVQNGRRVEYAYDAEGHRVARRLPWAAEADLEIGFDLRGRFTDLSDREGSFQHFTWDAADRLLERSCSDGLVETSEYDNAGAITSQIVRSGNGNVAVSRKYVYDVRGNVSRLFDGNEGWSYYQYDRLNRLVSVRRGDGSAEDFQYDEIGRIIAADGRARERGLGGQTKTDGVRLFDYDPVGNLQRIESNHDGANLEFDAFGRLSVFRDRNAVAVYAYDALGRRIRKETSEGETEFLWESCNLAGTMRNGKLTQTFYFRNGEPLGEWDRGLRRIPIRDRSAVVRELLTPSGTLVWRGSYATYGGLRTSAGPSENNLRFRGQYHDNESGLTYNFYRYYDSALGDYISPDPIGISGGCNFYAYSRNPLIWDDPFGLTCGKSNKQHGGETEQEMHEYFEGEGFMKLSTDGRSRGIDGVYVNTNPPPKDQPPFIIAEAKYNTSPLGTTVHSGDQMENGWIDSEIGKPKGGDDRLAAALGSSPLPGATANDITTQGADKYVYRQPAGGGPPVVTKIGTYP